MPLSRRELMRRASVLGAATVTPGALTACSSSDGGDGGGSSGAAQKLPMTLFAHGVASGDPTPDAVIIWTRVSPELLDSAPAGVIEVSYEVATDPALQNVIADGSFSTDESRDFTVKVDVTGLDAGTTYYYRFYALENGSMVGRTRTAPSGSVERLRFGVCSCASYAHGYYHAYRHMGEQQDLDVILHLGDYIYEYGTGQYGEVREYEPSHEILTLEDYRTRYKQHRRDPDLQLVHQQHPFICVWDDHETTDNSWKDGAANHQSDEGDWEERKAAGYQAFIEWLPIREQEDLKVWRAFSYGDLVDLIMLDTRIWGREEQFPPGDERTLTDERTILGADQEAWLKEQLEASTAQWRVIGQQVMLMDQPSFLESISGGDAWDGYPKSRERFLDVLEANDIDDVVIVTGDIHMSFAGDIPRDPNDGYDAATGSGSLCVEFVCPGITSPGSPFEFSLAENHIKYNDAISRGYFVLDITTEKAQAGWWHVQNTGERNSTVEDPENYNLAQDATWTTRAGENHVVEENEAASPRDEVPTFAPDPALTSA